MKRHPELSKEELEALLRWFSADREEAGSEYEKIRQGLIRFFRFRGCADSAALTDETINRVAKKLETLEISANMSKVALFHGFALFVFKEYLRDGVKESKAAANFYPTETAEETDPVDEKNLFCFRKCLKNLLKQEQEFLMTYYSKQKKEKIELRKKMAEEMGITNGNLSIRVYRIKEKLKNCMKECKNENKV